MGAAPGGTGAPGSLTAGSWLHPQHPTRSPQSPETGRPAFAGDSRSVLSPPAPTGCRGSAPSRQVTPALVARGDCPDQSCGQGPCLGHPLPPPTPVLCLPHPLQHPFTLLESQAKAWWHVPLSGWLCLVACPPPVLASPTPALSPADSSAVIPHPIPGTVLLENPPWELEALPTGPPELPQYLHP